jgi:hypothetical protein
LPGPYLEAKIASEKLTTIVAVRTGKMTKHDETSDGAALRPTVWFIVDADEAARVAIESALLRRLAPDYRVLTANSRRRGRWAICR